MGEVLAESDTTERIRRAVCSSYGCPSENCLPRIYIISTVDKTKLNESHA